MKLPDDSPLRQMLSMLETPQAKSLFDRVEELRARIVRLALLMVAFICVGFYFAKDFINFMKIPLANAMPPGVTSVLNFTGPMEVMLSYMKVSFLLAIVFASPYAFYQTWKFLGPSLPPATRKMVVPFVSSSVTLFLGGGAFGYFLMLPMGLKWLVGYGSNQATPVITVQEYVDLITFMLLAFGCAFQLPLVLVVLERFGIITEAMLRKHRGIALVAILILAAVAAPSPDPVSQLVMATPMYLLYEAAILIIHWLKRNDTLPVPVA